MRANHGGYFRGGCRKHRFSPLYTRPKLRSLSELEAPILFLEKRPRIADTSSSSSSTRVSLATYPLDGVSTLVARKPRVSFPLPPSCLPFLRALFASRTLRTRNTHASHVTYATSYFGRTTIRYKRNKLQPTFRTKRFISSYVLSSKIQCEQICEEETCDV